MQIIENLKVKEKLYVEKLENGMTVMIIPRNNMQKKYAIISTKYGSVDNEFIIPGEKKSFKSPSGVAHFLEHKLFEQENGTNSLDVLSSLGANANAYTANDHTAYLFECTDNFYESLDELFDYIQHPYFTDKNIEKEKGIIAQEIMMYEDYPEWVVYMNAIKNMYKNHPIRLDTVGTVKSISKINKEILYKCYNTFYNPSNMIICIAGDFEPEKIIKEIKKRIINKPVGVDAYADTKKETQKPKNIEVHCMHPQIQRIYTEEPTNIVKKSTETTMQVSLPIFIIGIKDKIENKENIIKRHLAIELLLNILIGKSSKLYKKLYDTETIKSELYLEYEFSDTYAHIMITGQSKEPKKVLKELQDIIKKYKEEGINENDFERIKKMIYGSYIKDFNNISDMSNMFISDYFKGINSFDYLDNFDKITIDFANQILREVFNKDRTTISIVKGK